MSRYDQEYVDEETLDYEQKIKNDQLKYIVKVLYSQNNQDSKSDPAKMNQYMQEIEQLSIHTQQQEHATYEQLLKKLKTEITSMDK